MRLLLSFIEIIIGAAVLGWSADRFIVSSSSLAKHLKLPSLVVGIILVGFGTSFPELIVSIIASMQNKAPIAIGNVIGSNIANIGLVLGLAAIIMPIKVNSRLIRREFPILIIVSVLIGVLLWNDYLGRWEGAVLLVMLAMHLYWIVTSAPKKDDAIVAELEHESTKTMSLKPAIIWWFVGLVLIFLSSELLIHAAVHIAEHFGISELVIGLTIVTIGTSLPELAATIMSAIRKEYDIAIGHIVGSNIFNSLAVLAMPALIAPGSVSASLMHRDYPIMMAYTVILWLAMFCFSRQAKVGRLLGLVFLAGYLLYLASLILL